MATVMLLHWPEASAAQYDQVHAKVRWDEDVPQGAQLHLCGFADDGMHILDVWDSEADFNNFFEQRILPAVQAVGISGQPAVTFYPLHSAFVPALGKNKQSANLS